MKIHELKTSSRFFDLVWRRFKTFEIRWNEDRKFQTNDECVLREWDKEIRRYSGKSIRVKINFVINEYEIPGLKPGYVLFGFTVIALSGEKEDFT